MNYHNYTEQFTCTSYPNINVHVINRKNESATYKKNMLYKDDTDVTYTL